MNLYGDPFIAVAVSGLSFDHKPNSFEYMLRHKSFANEMLTPGDFLLSIASGFSYGAWTLAGEGNAITFLKSSIISLDLEGGPEAAPDRATDNDFYRRYGLVCYTTLSHTPDNPRCRIIFALEAPITNEREYRDTAQAIASMWPSSVVDKGTVDPVRRFLGNPNTNMIVNGEMLDSDIAAGMCDAWRIQQARLLVPKPPQSSKTFANGNGGAPDFLLNLLNAVATTNEGERNNALNKCAFKFGQYAVGPNHMQFEVAEALLVAAGEAAGLSYIEAAKTVKSGLTRGMVNSKKYQEAQR